ncbi:MAG: hypothetical protein KA054_03025 [Candidatus Moranbacteria bacterium]|nr:hypothetical protein [Candidatus Moranbacteria bacterium]
MFSLLSRHFARRIVQYFSQNRAAKITTTSLFILLLLALSVGIFSFFLHGFRFLAFSGYFREIILLYLSELFMLTILILVSVSALITGLFSLFSGKDRLLALSPKFPLMPFLVLSRMFLTSLWPILLLVVPALLALSLTYTVSFPGALLTILALTLFVAFAVTSALSCLFLVAQALSSFRKSFLGKQRLILFVFLISTFLIGIAWHHARSVSLHTLFSIETVEKTIADTTLIRSHFAVLPSHPAALAFFAASHDDIGLLFRSIAILCSLLGIALIPFLLLRKNHLAFWQHLQETDSAHITRTHSSIGALAHARGPLDALFRKEILAFFRNARNMSWFGFFCLIWLLQSGSLFILNHQLTERPTTIPYIVVALQIAAAIYFVNMFVLRFVFPSFSMEQKMHWVIESASIDGSKTFLARASFHVPFMTFLGLLFSLLNTITITLSFSEHVLVLGIIGIASTTVTLYGLALGALFPNFETDDPEFLSTSLPGLTFIFTSVLYGGCAAAATRSFLVSGEPTLLILFLIFSLLIVLLSLFTPLRHFRK